jgi:glycosyltransferase involved in cell wall biosynthesis
MNDNNAEKPVILIFSFAFWPFIGGAEVAIQEITKRLVDHFDFDLVTFDFSKKNRLPVYEKKDNVNIYRVGRGDFGYLSRFIFFYPWLAVKQAQKMKKDRNYVLVWSMMAMWASWAGLIFKEKNKKIPWLLSMQSGDSDFSIFLRTWFWFFRYKQIYQKTDRTQVISKWLEKRARKNKFSKKIDLVPNGVDLEKYDQYFSEDQKKDLRTELGILPEEKVIITTSRLAKKNGIIDLVKGFFEAQKKIDNLRLLVVGEGKERKKIEKLIKKLKIEKKVIMTGFVSNDEVVKYYKIADLFVRPSHSEGMGNSFIEAMYARVPVIATPVGGIVDFLKDVETGFFCKIKDARDLSAKIIYVLDEKNKVQIEIIKKKAHSMVKEKYSWDQVSHQMKNIFWEMINENNK